MIISIRWALFISASNNFIWLLICQAQNIQNIVFYNRNDEYTKNPGTFDKLELVSHFFYSQKETSLSCAHQAFPFVCDRKEKPAIKRWFKSLAAALSAFDRHSVRSRLSCPFRETARQDACGFSKNN